MLLALDVGNTNTVIGLYKLATEDSALEMVANWRITTSTTYTVDEFGVLLRNLFDLRGLKTELVDGIAISSVVPPLDTMLRRACEVYFNVKPLFLRPRFKT